MNMFISIVKKLLEVSNKYTSKKLFAFLVATALLWCGKVSEGVWEFIAISYIGVQGVYDTIAAMSSKKDKKEKAEKNE